MVRANALSTLGRMNYNLHLLFYPGAFAAYWFIGAPYMEQKNKKAEQEEWDGMVKHRPVDPDLFNPFTPIPFHNNPELKYCYAGVNMKNYISQSTHFNAAEYRWRNYHNSYDHGNKKTYLYNWTSV